MSYFKSIKFIDENGASYGIKEVDNKPVFATDGEVLEGNQYKLNIQDDNSEQLLSDILKELKKMNLHMSMMTDIIIKDTEIE